MSVMTDIVVGSRRETLPLVSRPRLPPGGGGAFSGTMQTPFADGRVEPARRSITEGIGRTPLLELRRMTAGLPGRVAVKVESRNPSGSVKDRVAAALVAEAEASGALRPGSTIVAPTS